MVDATRSPESVDRQPAQWRTRIAPFLPELVSLGVVLITILPLFTASILPFMARHSDFTVHLLFLQRLNTGYWDMSAFIARVPHFLYQWLVQAVLTLFPASEYIGSGYSVVLIFYVLLAVIIYMALRVFLGRPMTYRVGAGYGLATLALLLFSHIFLFEGGSKYYGYLAVNVYHSPTIMLLRPFAVLLFFLSLRVFTTQKRSLLELMGYAALSVLCLFAKPSFTVAYLPALAVVTLYHMIQRKPINWFLLLGGIVIPSGMMLAFQAAVFDTGSITVSPLAFFIARGSADFTLIPKLLLSILFPVVLYLAYFKEARRSLYLNLAWLTMFVGFAYTYFLSEEGRDKDGNWSWSGQIALFVLFVASIIFFLRQNRALLFDRKNFKLTSAYMWVMFTLVAHFVSGLYWYWIAVAAISA